MAFFRKAEMLSSIFSAAFALGAIFLLRQQFNYFLYLPSMYRVIYIPLFYWLICLLYLFTTYHIFFKKYTMPAEYVKRGICAFFFLHLYLLLEGLIIYLSENKTPLANLYFIYIKAAFLLYTAAMSSAALRRIRPGSAEAALFTPYLITMVYIAVEMAVSSRIALTAGLGAFAALGWAWNMVNKEAFISRVRLVFIKDLNLVVALFLIAFIIRAIFGVILVDKTTQGPRGYNGYTYASDDGLTYDEVAVKVAKDPSCLWRGDIKVWGNWDCMYAILLACVYGVFGRNFYAVVLIQALFGALIPVSIFLIGKELFSRTVGLVAAILLSFKGGSIMLSAYMGHEAVWLPIIFLFFVLETIYFKRSKSTGILLDAAMGAMLGAVILLRSMYIVFLPFLWVWELVFFKRVAISRKIIHLGVITVVSASIILGAFFIFHNELSPPPQDKMAYLGRSLVYPPFRNIGNERLSSLGIDFINNPKNSLYAIKEHPFKFAQAVAIIYPLRIIAYFETYQFGFFDPIYMVNPSDIKNKFASTLEFYFTIFFLTGLFICFLRKDILASPVFLALVYNVLLLSIILLRQSFRLKEISMPFVYLIGSFGAYVIFRFLNDRNKIEEQK